MCVFGDRNCVRSAVRFWPVRGSPCHAAIAPIACIAQSLPQPSSTITTTGCQSQWHRAGAHTRVGWGSASGLWAS